MRGQFSRCRSSIIIYSSAPLCLLALSLFITVLPLSACHTDASRAPWCTSAASSPTTAPHHHIRSQLFFFAVTDSPLLSRSLRSHLSRCSVPVSFFFFTATASRDPGDVEPGLSFGRGALTENFRESLSGGRQWGKEGIDGGWWIPVPCLRLTVGSTLKLPHRGDECERWAKKGRKCSPDWDGIAKS